MRARKARMAFVDCQIPSAHQPLLQAFVRATHDSIFALFYFLHINRDRAIDHHTVTAGASRDMSCASACDQRFGRDAAHIGMQPVLTQVPPNRLRSMIATFIPVPASRTASDGPACPVPIMIASYVVSIRLVLPKLAKTLLRFVLPPLVYTWQNPGLPFESWCFPLLNCDLTLSHWELTS